MNGDRLVVFGIRNCDTVKKARAWLEARGVDYLFHDYKSAGVDRAHLVAWCRTHGWESVLNRAGTTFKKLADAEKQGLTEPRAVALMLAQPSMIKRPIVQRGAQSIVGFTPERYAEFFAT